MQSYGSHVCRDLGTQKVERAGGANPARMGLIEVRNPKNAGFRSVAFSSGSCGLRDPGRRSPWHWEPYSTASGGDTIRGAGRSDIRPKAGAYKPVVPATLQSRCRPTPSRVPEFGDPSALPSSRSRPGRAAGCHPILAPSGTGPHTRTPVAVGTQSRGGSACCSRPCRY